MKWKKYISKNFKYNTLSKYQLVTRDIAFAVTEDTMVGNVIKSIEKIDKLVKKVELFDVYKGIGVSSGYKSFAIKIYMIDNEKTLSENEINKVIEKIKNKVINQYGASVR